MNTHSLLAQLAQKYGSDKGFHVLNAHGYTRVYESLLASVREQPVRLLEIGLLHPALHAQARVQGQAFDAAPSLSMWAEYLPQAQILGLDIEDFSAIQHPRIRTVRADQGRAEDLVSALAPHVGAGFDVIIDDGSHASHHQQITLGALWPMLKVGGVYIIEDLHYQPAALELPGLIKTRSLLDLLRTRRDISDLPCAMPIDQAKRLSFEAGEVLFFDSLDADRPNPQDSRDAMAVIQKRLVSN